jgi:Tfp pilus assembly protein PilF
VGFLFFLADVKTIKAIAGLWPLALAIGILVGMILAATVFRHQTRAFIDRLIRFSFTWGKAAIAVNQGSESTGATGPAPNKQETISEGQGASQAPPEKQDWETEMMMSFFDEEPEKAKVAYDRLQGEEKDPAKRIENEANYLFWSCRSGDGGAQARLRSLEPSAREFPDTLAQIRRLDALCYKFAGDKTRAAARFVEAAAAARSPVLRAQNFRGAAATLAECDRQSDAADLLVASLSETTDADAKATLYLGLADLYENDSAEVRAIMLEKALAYEPLNKDTHFAAAFAYSNCDMNGLAVVHYQKTLAISSKQEMATNNLGVALKALKLPLLAVRKYKKSIELGGTLAAANLAEIFADAGAADEAESILVEARKKDDCHQNVLFTANKLENTKSAEEERKKKIVVSAAKEQAFLLAYADALLNRGKWNLPDAAWSIPGAKDCSAKILDGSKLQVLWTIEEGPVPFRTIEKYRFCGELTGKSASGTVERFKRNVFDFKNPEAGTYEKVGRGHVFFDDDKLSLGFVTTADDEFRKIVCIPASHVTGS